MSSQHRLDEAAEPPALTLDQVSATGPNRFLQLLAVRELGIFAAAMAIFLILSVVSPIFPTASNLLNVVRQISLLGIIAVGMTYLLIAREIDLSVGSMYGLLATIMAYLVINEDWNPLVGMVATVVVGGLFGFFNGFVTTRFKIPSFIVTLGMLSVFRGGALLLSNGFPISGLESPGFKALTSGYAFGAVPAQIFWFLGIVLVGGWILAKTSFGYNVYATGGNTVSAANVGINTTRVKITCFVITGTLAGLAAALLVGWLRGVSPLTGQGFELDVIAAVIIGGTNLFGGSGSVLGTVLGAAIIGMISNGLVLLGVSSFFEPVVKGAVIILAVLLDVILRRRQTSS